MRSVVLLVDDDFLLREGLRDYLIDLGYDVRCAGDGTVALDLALSRPFDLLITDHWLPDWTGISILLSGDADPVPGLTGQVTDRVRLDRLAEDLEYPIDGRFQFEDGA